MACRRVRGSALSARRCCSVGIGKARASMVAVMVHVQQMCALLCTADEIKFAVDPPPILQQLHVASTSTDAVTALRRPACHCFWVCA